jgi:PD-(D/E)XK nuclease superfamily
MDIGEDRLSLLSSRIIGCALTVLHGLGAMGSWSREYTVDPLVEHIVLVELKVAKGIDEIHLAQCLNYLKPQACISACCSTSARLGLRSNASSWACKAPPSFACSACFAVPFSLWLYRPVERNQGRRAPG